jgi:hypothetical protein
MKPVAIWILLLFALAGAGCGGPLQTTLPARLDDKDQKKFDEAWEKAIREMGRYDHQAMLDVLMASKAYQAGVDTLTLRSEKRLADGRVVMEIHFDRLAPAEDRFEITVFDGTGRLLRKERYNREEVEKTQKELFVECGQLQQQRDQGKATPEQLARLDRYEARLKAIEEVFPKEGK